MLTEKLYTVNEAAKACRLSSWTIWDLLKRGRLMRTKVSGRTFIRKSELEKLVVDVPPIHRADDAKVLTASKAERRRAR